MITSAYFYIHVLYLPSPPPPAATSVTGTVVGILGGSLLISVAIGLGAFGFKTHRKEVERKEIVKEPMERARNLNEGTLNFVTTNAIEVEKSLSETDTECLLEDMKSVNKVGSVLSTSIVSESMDDLINDVRNPPGKG